MKCTEITKNTLNHRTIFIDKKYVLGLIYLLIRYDTYWYNEILINVNSSDMNHNNGIFKNTNESKAK